MARKNKILVPEARDGLDQLKAKLANQTNPEQVKYEVANETGVHLNRGYNGDIKAKDAGKIGGQIGGSMVRELVKMAQENLSKQTKQ
jgi:small acid-soluble spore protein D (minor alpha/beta-type SASP)